MLAVSFLLREGMANRRCSVWRYAKIDGKWRYVKPAFGRNNKIKPEGGNHNLKRK